MYFRDRSNLARMYSSKCYICTTCVLFCKSNQVGTYLFIRSVYFSDQDMAVNFVIA